MDSANARMIDDDVAFRRRRWSGAKEEVGGMRALLTKRVSDHPAEQLELISAVDPAIDGRDRNPPRFGVTAGLRSAVRIATWHDLAPPLQLLAIERLPAFADVAKCLTVAADHAAMIENACRRLRGSRSEWDAATRCRDCRRRFFGSFVAVRLRSCDDFNPDQKLRHFDRKQERELAGCEVPIFPVLATFSSSFPAFAYVEKSGARVWPQFVHIDRCKYAEPGARLHQLRLLLRMDFRKFAIRGSNSAQVIVRDFVVLPLIINQREAASSNIFKQKNFDLQKLGIGGLGEEFTHIFHRAFASRIFPPHVTNKYNGHQACEGYPALWASGHWKITYGSANWKVAQWKGTKVSFTSHVPALTKAAAIKMVYAAFFLWPLICLCGSIFHFLRMLMDLKF
ncbi:hypothetical protein KFK09_005417 [Dendrobium nobile]|uniref:Vesicle-fusing ATPase n=1 Tax=Dendrobium nobile TaxID=94219 RepID=A0A8T3BVR7_DENNO|nr:hypothetical protein KFK09_005417 [Dendrobium nobile]